MFVKLCTDPKFDTWIIFMLSNIFHLQVRIYHLQVHIYQFPCGVIFKSPVKPVPHKKKLVTWISFMALF